MSNRYAYIWSILPLSMAKFANISSENYSFLNRIYLGKIKRLQWRQFSYALLLPVKPLARGMRGVICAVDFFANLFRLI